MMAVCMCSTVHSHGWCACDTNYWCSRCRSHCRNDDGNDDDDDRFGKSCTYVWQRIPFCSERLDAKCAKTQRHTVRKTYHSADIQSVCIASNCTGRSKWERESKKKTCYSLALRRNRFVIFKLPINNVVRERIAPLRFIHATHSLRMCVYACLCLEFLQLNSKLSHMKMTMPLTCGCVCCVCTRSATHECSAYCTMLQLGRLVGWSFAPFFSLVAYCYCD